MYLLSDGVHLRNDGALPRTHYDQSQGCIRKVGEALEEFIKKGCRFQRRKCSYLIIIDTRMIYTDSQSWVKQNKVESSGCMAIAIRTEIQRKGFY